MNPFKAILILIGTLALGSIGTASAQVGYDPFQAQMDAYNQQMDAYMEQQMQIAQQRVDEAYANMLRFFIDYYRDATGDYAATEDVAAHRGAVLHCQHHPVQCQENVQHAQAMSRISAAGHAQNMADIQSWGRTMMEVGQNSSTILDASHEGFRANQAAQDQGQANLVENAVHGESTFLNPNGGANFRLPVQPEPNTSYRSPDGYPLSFDYATGTWYQADAFGWWYPLQQQR